jgi:hypothetical protein
MPRGAWIKQRKLSSTTGSAGILAGILAGIGRWGKQAGKDAGAPGGLVHGSKAPQGAVAPSHEA